MLADTAGIGEWGFAALVEADGYRVLFDRGARRDTVLRNAEELKVDLAPVADRHAALLHLAAVHYPDEELSAQRHNGFLGHDHRPRPDRGIHAASTGDGRGRWARRGRTEEGTLRRPKGRGPAANLNPPWQYPQYRETAQR